MPDRQKVVKFLETARCVGIVAGVAAEVMIMIGLTTTYWVDFDYNSAHAGLFQVKYLYFYKHKFKQNLFHVLYIRFYLISYLTLRTFRYADKAVAYACDKKINTNTDIKWNTLKNTPFFNPLAKIVTFV